MTGYCEACGGIRQLAHIGGQYICRCGWHRGATRSEMAAAIYPPSRFLGRATGEFEDFVTGRYDNTDTTN